MDIDNNDIPTKMRRTLSTILVVSAICGEGGLAFTPASREYRTTKLYSNTSNDSSRRNFLTTAATTVIATASTLIVSPNSALADLSDGNSLPQGMSQFSRVLNVRSQLKSVAKRVAEQSSEIDKKEWDKIDDFLRTVYSAGNDMKVISKGIFDPTKKSKAEEDIKLLQNLVQAAQKPVSKQDAAGFNVIATKADGVFEDFFDQLRDVPADL